MKATPAFKTRVLDTMQANNNASKITINTRTPPAASAKGINSSRSTGMAEQNQEGCKGNKLQERERGRQLSRLALTISNYWF